MQAFRRGRRRRWAPPTGPPRVRDRFGPGARVSQRLHPPILRTLGMHKKISLGPWSTPVFRLLAGARRLRGTPFDLFGYARVRWVERDANHGLAVTIAGLPDEVRGYEQVRLDNVTRYRQRLNDLRLELKRSHPVSTP
ncbi:DUF6537 domain-containing protein [Streptomyces sp. NPDC001868]|uniref:DUF6537 domain-containing protein n=1 Tax=Streptomyces sp. NPDC001868 TaxID=3154401 RepID=UPI003328A767